MDNPDLQSILASLAKYATPPQPLTTTSDTANVDALPLPTRSGSVSLLPREPETAADPRLKPQSRSAATASPKPMIDPATITTWQDGIRCVTKIAAQNAQFAASIRKVSRFWYLDPASIGDSLTCLADDRRPKEA